MNNLCVYNNLRIKPFLVDLCAFICYFVYSYQQKFKSKTICVVDSQLRRVVKLSYRPLLTLPQQGFFLKRGRCSYDVAMSDSQLLGVESVCVLAGGGRLGTL